MEKKVPVKTYILQHKNGSYVAVDQASGGEFYLTEQWQHARIWTSEQDARNYMQSYANSVEHRCSKDWTLYKIKLQTFPVPDSTKFGTSETCVHTQHCCSYHGCKYGDEDCPVENHKKHQDNTCEACWWNEYEKHMSA